MLGYVALRFDRAAACGYLHFGASIEARRLGNTGPGRVLAHTAKCDQRLFLGRFIHSLDRPSQSPQISRLARNAEVTQGEGFSYEAMITPSNRLAGSSALPAPTPPVMRVRIRRSQMPAASVLTAPALGQLARDGQRCSSQTKLAAPARQACFSSLRSQRDAIQILASQSN